MQPIDMHQANTDWLRIESGKTHSFEIHSSLYPNLPKLISKAIGNRTSIVKGNSHRQLLPNRDWVSSAR